MNTPYLVLFDIDGTLLWSDGIGKAAMRTALLQVYETTGPIDSYNFAGMTDRKIVNDLMRLAGLAPEVVAQGFSGFCVTIESELFRLIAHKKFNVAPCPGSHEIVDSLKKRSDVILGIATGNLRATADLKLEAAGFSPEDFRVGGYGQKAEERSELVGEAIRQAARLVKVKIYGPDLVVIGDTPADISSGKKYDASSVGVATGYCSYAELEQAQPTLLLKDLTGSQHWLKTLLPEKKG